MATKRGQAADLELDMLIRFAMDDFPAIAKDPQNPDQPFAGPEVVARRLRMAGEQEAARARELESADKVTARIGAAPMGEASMLEIKKRVTRHRDAANRTTELALAIESALERSLVRSHRER